MSFLPLLGVRAGVPEHFPPQRRCGHLCQMKLRRTRWLSTNMDSNHDKKPPVRAFVLPLHHRTNLRENTAPPRPAQRKSGSVLICRHSLARETGEDASGPRSGTDEGEGFYPAQRD